MTTKAKAEKPRNHKVLETLKRISGKELTLGNLLWSIREGEESSLLHFSECLGISRQYLCDIEQGRRFISPKKAAEYAKKLGYSVNQFVRLCLQDMIDRDGIHLKVELKKAA